MVTGVAVCLIALGRPGWILLLGLIVVLAIPGLLRSTRGPRWAGNAALWLGVHPPILGALFFGVEGLGAGLLIGLFAAVLGGAMGAAAGYLYDRSHTVESE